MNTSSSSLSQRPRSRWPQRLAVVLAVLAAHVVLLQGLGAWPLQPAEAAEAAASPAPVRPVSVRRLPSPAEPPPEASPEAPAEAPPPAAPVVAKPEAEAPRPEVPVRQSAAAAALSPQVASAPPAEAPSGPEGGTEVLAAALLPPQVQAEAPSAEAVPETPSQPRPEMPPATPAEPLVVAAAPTAAASGAGGPEDLAAAVPVYPTRLPPAFTLDYELRRGSLVGSGLLSWQPGPPYRFQLEGRVPLFGTVITQTSQGGRDAHGLAPLRFTDRRLGRSEQAANFQRDSGRIGFSGPSTTYPLVPGAQDRLSWMLQLAAIVEAAAPQQPPERISMFLVGARGDASVWTFLRAGSETLRVDGQPLETVKLEREPRRPHDTRAEIWLAPAAHHLPVRARLGSGDGGESFELRLRQLPDSLRE